MIRKHSYPISHLFFSNRPIFSLGCTNMGFALSHPQRNYRLGSAAPEFIKGDAQGVTNRTKATVVVQALDSEKESAVSMGRRLSFPLSLFLSWRLLFWMITIMILSHMIPHCFLIGNDIRYNQTNVFQ